jgi:antirepressor protein
LSNEFDEEHDEQESEQETQALLPIVQETIIFHGKPLVVVRLPDGRPGVVLRWICENLHLAPGPQVLRIRRTEVIASDLVYTQVQTEGGFQNMPTLVLDSVPYWLATIDTRRMAKDDPNRLEILEYQRRAVAALFAWAASVPKAIATPMNLIPAEPITKPIVPGDDASLDEWREYHRQMVVWIDWQHDIETWRGRIETWRGSMESRMEGVEAMTGLIPEILERLGTEKLTDKHQAKVRQYVNRLHEATGKHQQTIYTDLYRAFEVPKYQDILESDWLKVEEWFRVQLERARKTEDEQQL